MSNYTYFFVGDRKNLIVAGIYQGYKTRLVDRLAPVCLSICLSIYLYKYIYIYKYIYVHIFFPKEQTAETLNISWIANCNQFLLNPAYPCNNRAGTQGTE